MRFFLKNVLNRLFQVSYSSDNKHVIYKNRFVKFKFKRRTYNWYKSNNDETRIRKYLEYKKHRIAKGVVYTCITNDYDKIEEINIYKYIDNDWDYVLFTDNEEQIKKGQVGIWEIRPIQFTELDNTRNQRWHKTHPHNLFPDYQKSLWIDANINILTDYVFKIANKTNQPIMIPIHYKDNCIYQEYIDVLKYELDDANIIKQELNVIKNAGMPENYGFTETNILIRKHLEPDMISLQNEWWDFIYKYSKRDQLSCMYLLWKRNIKTKNIVIKNTRLDKKDFFVMSHKKGKDVTNNEPKTSI